MFSSIPLKAHWFITLELSIDAASQIQVSFWKSKITNIYNLGAFMLTQRDALNTYKRNMSKAAQCPSKSILPFTHRSYEFYQGLHFPGILAATCSQAWVPTEYERMWYVSLLHLGLKTWASLVHPFHWLELSSDHADDDNALGNNRTTK